MYAAIFWIAIAFAGLITSDATPKPRPNFVVIITDDQGWDDIGLHNPSYVNTPNMDKFIRSSTFFDNFYVTPQCAQTRAALLTGRSYPRTGTVLVNGGYDFINKEEATAGQVMSAAGYQAMQFGKWHNKQSLGYEPWHAGFDFGQVTMATEGLVEVNGAYEGVENKDGDEQTMSALLEYLDGRRQTATSAGGADGARPFFVYFAPHAIHVERDRADATKITKVRVYPDTYRDKYYNNTKYAGINHATKDAWAMLEFLDAQLGRLLAYLDASGLRENTYVMLLSDNGAALMPGESRKLRIPSGMMGNKSTVFEGGVRNFLAVQGPGVQPGVIDSTLLDVTDILPTIADLAGIQQNAAVHKPWDGISFMNLLLHGSKSSSSNSNSSSSNSSSSSSSSNALNTTGSSSNSSSTGWVVRGTSLANQRQINRFLVILGPQCWDPNAVLQLGNYSRKELRPQPLLNYLIGGMRNSIHSKEMPSSLLANQQGFQVCLAVRHKNFKWIGATNKVYRFVNGSHLEVPANEVPEPFAAQMVQLLSSAAKSWWESIAAEPNSFVKPTFYLGLGNWTATNVLAMGAHERTEGSITLMAMGVAGFKDVGNRICFKVKVLTAGQYDVIAMYTSNVKATFKLSVGTFSSISKSTAPGITAQLPQLSVLQGMSMGSLNLPISPHNTITEACLELVDSSAPGTPVFRNLANLRFVRRTDLGPDQDALLAVARPPISTSRKDSNSSTGESSKAPAALQAAGRLAVPAMKSVATAVPASNPKATVPMRFGQHHRVRYSNSSVKNQASGPQKAAVAHPVVRHSSKRAAVVRGRDAGGLAAAAPKAAQSGNGVAGREDVELMPAGSRAARRGLHPSRRSESALHRPADVTVTASSNDWDAMRQKYLFVDGQVVMESLFSPYDTEDIDGCTQCQPVL